MENLQQNFYSVLEDDDLDVKDENKDINGDEVQDGEFRFFGEVYQLSDDDDLSDFSWETDSDDQSLSDDDNAPRRVVEVCGSLGGLYVDVGNKFKTFYRFVEPDRQTSCNSTAATLKEPVSLLTKYRSQRLGGHSKYFRSAFSGAPNPIRRRRRRSPLAKVHTVNYSTV